MTRKIATAARFEPATRTIRSVPENYWLASMDSWDGAVDHDAMALIFAAAPSMLAALERIAEGSKVDGRWLDTNGNECDEAGDGARWEQYSGEEQDLWLQSVAEIAAEAISAARPAPTTADATPIPAAPADGLYSPELAEAFRQGARELCNRNLGSRIGVDVNARVEEYDSGDGGAIVHCTIYVSDSERAALAGEES